MRSILALGFMLSAVMAADVPSAKAAKNAPPVAKEFIAPADEQHAR